MIIPKAKKLRDLMAKNELLIGVGARDALDAKLIEETRFDFIWSSSFGVSASFAVPDASLISMSQYLNAARSMNEVINIPLIIDADTGYGNANNVIYAVKLFEEAGIAGLSIEDKKFPKDSKAAKDSQKSNDFVVIARVEALIAGWGQEEALIRAERYAEEGADCILIHSKSDSPDEMLDFIGSWNGRAPLVIIPTTYPSLTEEKIIALRKVKFVIYANQIFRAAVKAERRILKEIKRAGGIHTVGEMIAEVNDLFELQGVPQMKNNEKKYLR
jgi:2-methylisocitrate lyase-like PEP mutase family enzyme